MNNDVKTLIIDNIEEFIEDILPLVNKLKNKREHFKDEFRLEFDINYFDNVYEILLQYISVSTGLNKIEINEALEELNEQSNNRIWELLYEKIL